MSEPSWPGREEIARRARRRWWLMMGLIIVVVAVAVPLGDAIGLTGDHHHRAPHHHTTTAIAIILPIAFLALVGAGYLVLRRMMRNPQGRFAPPIAAGLPRRQRREAGRNVRRGTPSRDPVLAGVEHETAHRTITQARFTITIFVIALLGEAAEAITQSSTAARIFFSAAVILFAVMLG